MKKFFFGFVIGGFALYFTVVLKPSLVITAEVKQADTTSVDTTKIVPELSPVMQPSTVQDTTKSITVK